MLSKNKFLISLLMLVSLVCSSNVLLASESDSFDYYGDPTDVFKALDEDVYRTEWRDVPVQTTCTRQVPYPHQVCDVVTRYRQECRQIPVTRRVCNLETRYRQVCQDRPQRVCENRPVCTIVNGRRVCRNEQVCRQVNQRVCQQVPYQEQVCRDITEYRQECRQVPYQDQVCRTETRYRTEYYACTQYERRQVREFVGRTQANLTFSFRKAPDVLSPQSRFNLSLREGSLFVEASNLNPSDDTLYVAAKRMNRSQNGTTTYLDVNYDVSVLNADRFFSPVSRPFSIAPQARDGVLYFNIAQVYYLHTFGVNLVVYDQNSNLLFNRQLENHQFQVQAGPNGESRVVVDLKLLLNRPVGAGDSFRVDATALLKMDNREILNFGRRGPTQQQASGYIRVE